MKHSLLHITDNDNITQKLQKSSIKGTVITWRETLCEGKTTVDVGSESFWRMRFDFLKTSYKISKKNFIDYTVKEYRNLCNYKKKDEIVLWFDTGLFSQINMIAVISWLKRYKSNHQISLAQNLNNEDVILTFKNSSKNQLNKSFQSKITLSENDIEYADYIWQLYCADNPIPLENVHTFNSNSPFIALEKAIKTHLLRFPSIENGLNHLENTILNTANNQVFTTKTEFINQLIYQQENLGFSENQYSNQLNRLKKLFTSFNPVKLSRIGKKVLHTQTNYYAKIRSDFSYLGGAKKYSYLYVNTTGKLLKITS